MIAKTTTSMLMLISSVYSTGAHHKLLSERAGLTFVQADKFFSYASEYQKQYLTEDEMITAA